MPLNKHIKRGGALLLSLSLLALLSIPGAAAADDFDYVTSHINLQPGQYTSNVDTSPIPQYDVGLESGASFQLLCYTTAGSTVTATLGDKSYNLTGSGTKFTATIKIPTVSGVVDLGKVTYNVQAPGGGTASRASTGTVVAVGDGESLRVQVTSPSACVFKTTTETDGFLTTAQQGGIDYVTQYYGDKYKLSCGGWVKMNAVKPLTSTGSIQNTVSRTSFTSGSGGETFTLHGTSYPLFVSSQDSSSLTLTFQRTTGVGSISTAGSQLFSSASVSEDNGRTTITFKQAQSGALWGYLVEYKDGNINIYCKYKPRLSSDASQPLKGITVGIDPGHGGNDSGAPGYGGVVEKDVNLATGIALQKKLELQGATVVMTRTTDVDISLEDRLAFAKRHDVDFFISLHGNASNSSSSNGVEVFYYEGISRNIARSIEKNIVSSTGRTSRGERYGYFMVTLPSWCPSVLVEQGFMNNPSDYGDMITKNGIYNTVTAISNSIKSSLG